MPSRRTLPCTPVDEPAWLALRQALWPEATRQEHLAEIQEQLAQPARWGQFICRNDAGQALVFEETERVVYFRKRLQ